MTDVFKFLGNLFWFRTPPAVLERRKRREELSEQLDHAILANEIMKAEVNAITGGTRRGDVSV